MANRPNGENPEYTLGITQESEKETPDELYPDAIRLVFEFGKASTSLLQRRLRIGYGRAAHLIDLMEEDGLVGVADGPKPREVLKPTGWLESQEGQNFFKNLAAKLAESNATDEEPVVTSPEAQQEEGETNPEDHRKNLRNALKKVWDVYTNPALQKEIAECLSPADKEKINEMAALLVEEGSVLDIKGKTHAAPRGLNMILKNQGLKNIKDIVQCGQKTRSPEASLMENFMIN